MPSYISNQGPSGVATSLPSLSIGGVPTMGMAGLPLTTGNVYFCDYLNGNDGNDGSGDFPYQTLSAAYGACTAGQNDVVVIVGNGGTSASQRLSETFTWAKNATHLVGMTAPTINQRARIAPLTTATTNINPLMAISAVGCIFSNFSMFQGIGQSSTAEQLIDITGDENYFGNIFFGGMGHANSGAEATSYIIKLNDGDENTFQNCIIGLETISRTAANASVVVTGGSQRNQFFDCLFMMQAKTNTTPLFLDLSASNCLNGSSMTFRRCLFQNLTGVTGSAVPAVLASLAVSINGVLVMDQCTTNVTKWAAATTQMIISGFAIGNGFSSGRFATAADS